MAASHQGKGWEKFTDAAVAAVAADPAPKVFILWGSHAQKKAANVPGLGADSPHLILRAPHPSPLSAHNGFRSEEHTSELQSLMRISYAVFCLKKKNKNPHIHSHHHCPPRLPLSA